MPSAGTAPQAVLVNAPDTAAPADTPVYSRWWFWTLVGAAVVGAGVGIAAATGVFNQTETANCPDGFTCLR